MAFFAYDLATGRLLHWISGDGVTNDWVPAGQAVIEAPGARPDDVGAYRVVGGALQAKAALPATLDKSTIAANGVDTATITGIPATARLRITDVNGTTTREADGTALEITADAAGDIAVAVSLFPYQAHTFTVTAT